MVLKHQLTILFSDEQLAFMDKRAEEHRVSKAHVLRAALHQMMQREHKPVVKGDIEPMTPEEFFLECESNGVKQDMRLSLKIWGPEPEEEGGGYRVDTHGRMSYGDTLGVAIRAAYDHLRELPSQWARLNPGFFASDPPRRVDYDYRFEDYVPSSDEGVKA